jgi:DNA-binding NarL/FixJ family response regulator
MTAAVDTPTAELERVRVERVRVVVVDDSEPLRALLSQMLAAAACDVVGEASDGGEAIEVVRATAPDVVILDLHMPDVDGLQALRVLAPGCPDTTFLMFTSGDAAAVAACLQAGADGHFLKQDIVALVGHVAGLGARVAEH